MDSKIYSITAHEILDSRGVPTVETTVILNSGYRGTAAVPSGASVGKYEAVELRDDDSKRYDGKGVLNAVSNVNTVLGPRLKGIDALNQVMIDKKMIELDQTPNKSNLGANAILSISMATVMAASAHQRLPLYGYLNLIAGGGKAGKMPRIPTPTFNVINGGKHGGGSMDFQEYHIIPASNRSFHDGLRMGAELYHAVKELLVNRGSIHATGDEGGFAPNLATNIDPLELLAEAIRSSPYRFGADIFFGLDLAASSFYSDRGYQIKDRPMPYRTVDFIDYIRELHKMHPILLLEDPLAEDDWNGWVKLNEEVGRDILVIGDDLLTTNPARLERAIESKACSAILLKPNQIGTLTEFLQVVAIAKKNDIKTIVSHRSGETNDTYIADLAVAIQSDYIKFGAPARGERVGKYNRLLAIEKELKL